MTERSRAWLVLQTSELGLAVPAEGVSEIWRGGVCVPLPAVPDYVIGLANWSGKPLPILDLSAALGLRNVADGGHEQRHRVASGESRVVVVRTGGFMVGMLADRVVGLHVEPMNEGRERVLNVGRVGEFAVTELDTSVGVAAALDLSRLLAATRVGAQ